jgi:hypothetical protein
VMAAAVAIVAGAATVIAARAGTAVTGDLGASAKAASARAVVTKAPRPSSRLRF